MTRFCTRCVISDRRPSSVVAWQRKPGDKSPSIAFDEEGVCAACRYAERKREIDWSQRERELLELLDRHRSKDGSPDCVVPGSGGKDSCFAAHVLRTKYGMHPLTVTWAPMMWTDVGRRNYERWADAGEHVLAFRDERAHRAITRAAFERTFYPFSPFVVGQRIVGPRMSARYNIPLVFYGENPAEYGNAAEENASPIMPERFYAADGAPVLAGGTSLERWDALGFNVSAYWPVSHSALRDAGTECHYLGYYLRWHPQEVYYYAAEHCGFECNDRRTEGSYSKYSSIDDKLDYLHYWCTLILYGLGRASYDAAQEIRNGVITREEGVALVKRFDQERPARYLGDILEYIGMDEREFDAVCDDHRDALLWEKPHDSGIGWQLREAVWK